MLILLLGVAVTIATLIAAAFVILQQAARIDYGERYERAAGFGVVGEEAQVKLGERL